MNHLRVESPHYDTLVTILTNENKRGKSPERLQNRSRIAGVFFRYLGS